MKDVAKQIRWTLGLLFLGVALALAWRIGTARIIPAAQFPVGFTHQDRTEIGRIIKKDSFRRIFRALKTRKFLLAWESAKNAGRENYWGVSTQGDPLVSIMVGRLDPTQTMGYRSTSHYVLRKQGDHWQIVSTDF